MFRFYDNELYFIYHIHSWTLSMYLFIYDLANYQSKCCLKTQRIKTLVTIISFKQQIL
jgi:hypothetical protein